MTKYLIGDHVRASSRHAWGPNSLKNPKTVYGLIMAERRAGVGNHIPQYQVHGHWFFGSELELVGRTLETIVDIGLLRELEP